MNPYKISGVTLLMGRLIDAAHEYATTNTPDNIRDSEHRDSAI